MPTTDIPEPVGSFIGAVNAHDEEGFLGAFADGGAIDDFGRIVTGHAEIKGWSDSEFIGANGTLTPEEVAVDGDQVTVVGDWRSTRANGRSSFTFDVVGDAIAKMTIREG